MSRSNYKSTSFEITSDQGRQIANKFYDQQRAANSLALILPGLRYSCDMPLLYYATELLLIRGFDVLQLWSDYSNPEFRAASKVEQAQYLLGDSLALFEAASKGEPYERTVLVGKSIGTLSMALLLNVNRKLADDATIWLTPLLNLEPVTQAVKNLKGPTYLAGSNTDPTFEPETVSQIQSRPNVRVDVIKDADHSLEIPGNLRESMRVLTKVVTSLASFIS